MTLKIGEVEEGKDGAEERLARKETCACCHKVFVDEEALRAHWTLKQHSEHDAVCSACGRHFPSYDTLRQHLIGNLPKKSCAEAYAKAGCDKCYEVFASEEEKRAHALDDLSGQRLGVVAGLGESGHHGSAGALLALDAQVVVQSGLFVLFHLLIQILTLSLGLQQEKPPHPSQSSQVLLLLTQ